MRDKRTVLVEALTGRFGDHHAFLARTMLDRIDAGTATESRLTERIGEQVAPFRRQLDLLATLPGVSAGFLKRCIHTGAAVGGSAVRVCPRSRGWQG
ncbi:hypothetical protein ABZ725_37195, partial [Streptomyces sp. NPDC006872]